MATSFVICICQIGIVGWCSNTTSNIELISTLFRLIHPHLLPQIVLYLLCSVLLYVIFKFTLLLRPNMKYGIRWMFLLLRVFTVLSWLYNSIWGTVSKRIIIFIGKGNLHFYWLYFKAPRFYVICLLWSLEYCNCQE